MLDYGDLKPIALSAVVDALYQAGRTEFKDIIRGLRNHDNAHVRESVRDALEYWEEDEKDG